jgi:polyhydroxyalkanoate synthesis repressor PhaR
MLRFMLQCNITQGYSFDRTCQAINEAINMALKTLIIKKYENRRLYNTATSQYINQDQVAQLVREGHDVRVVDAVTGEDLTRMILAQIVVEDAKEPDSVFPLDILRQMIVASGRATQESALHYMKSMMSLYQNAFPAMPAPGNPLEFLRWLQPAGPSSPPATPVDSAQPNTGESSAREEALKQRIAELESMIPKTRTKKKAAKSSLKSRRKS